MAEEVVQYEVSERIATVTLNRPEARNALSSTLLRDLNARMHEANDRDDVDDVDAEAELQTLADQAKTRAVGLLAEMQANAQPAK